MKAALDPALLEILVCPVSKRPLVQTGDYLISTDPETRRRYRIVDGIPDMLIEESEVLPMDEWKEAMAQANRA